MRKGEEKLQGWKKRGILFGFGFVTLLLIIYLTFQTPSRSMELSDWFGVALVKFSRILHLKNRDRVEWWIMMHTRQIGHVLEYYPLGLFLSAVLYEKTETIRFFGKATLICAAVSLTDQMVKAFLPTRHFDAADLLFDLAGYLLGCCTIWAMKRIERKLRGRTCK